MKSELNSESSDEALVRAIRRGDSDLYAVLVKRYQPRLFAMARRYARRESEVEDIVQEILIKAYTRLDGWRGDAAFEHWLMKISVRVCYDFLRVHQRSREVIATELSTEEVSWLEQQPASDRSEWESASNANAARTLVGKVLDKLSPASRLVITLLELEDRSVREVADLTGWSSALVKVRAFRARAEMKRLLERIETGKFL